MPGAMPHGINTHISWARPHGLPDGPHGPGKDATWQKVREFWSSVDLTGNQTIWLLMPTYTRFGAVSI